MRLKSKWFSCTFVNVHAPTSEKREEIKEEFYILREETLNQKANSDIRIIVGDFNAKFVKENVKKRTSSYHSVF